MYTRVGESKERKRRKKGNMSEGRERKERV